MSKPQMDLFNTYYREVKQKYETGDSTEFTLRTPLENLITSIDAKYILIHEPKRKAGLGAPDYKAIFQSSRIGYIETKDLGIDLEKELEGDQVKKYREAVDNIILTDYRRFILIRHGEIAYDLELFKKTDFFSKGIGISKESVQEFLNILNLFFSYNIPTISKAQDLALQLSKRSRLLQYYSLQQLEEDYENERAGRSYSRLFDFFLGLQTMIEDIDIDECADAYAETITYGLFLAKINCGSKELRRDTAASFVPQSIGIMRTLFMNISGPSLPPHISWIPDEIVEVLNAADIDTILKEIRTVKKKSIKDPFSFFYENFIEAYDSDRKKRRGVYFTPRPIVHFIVNALNNVLKSDFGMSTGFADDDVKVLDVATGTGTFLWLVFLVSLVELVKRKMSGLIKSKIREHLLQDFYGFEIMITPYVVAHLKLASMLSQWHYKLNDNERIQVYLTNTLEPTEVHGLIPFLRDMNEETVRANVIKGLEEKILVVLGNPPYSRISDNNGEWIDDLLKKGYTRPDGSRDFGYYKVDQKPLDEKNPRWLQDDYVKFIRYAQWKIDMAGEGIVGYITNHSYLDNPTFKGMRQSLLNSFDAIYILNLHGHARKGKCSNGSKDENVFEIKQGVAISIFIKKKDITKKGIYYADVCGSRMSKFSWLDNRTKLDEVNWSELLPCSPDYLLIPVDDTIKMEYNQFWMITDIFDKRSVGITTGRDKFALAFSKEEMESRIEAFRGIRYDDAYWRKEYELNDKPNWELSEARESLRNSEDWIKHLIQIHYRPFDFRWTIFHDSIMERSRKRIMKHMIAEDLSCNPFGVKNGNIAMVVSRISAKEEFDSVMVTKIPSEIKMGESTRNSYFVPLYLIKKGPRKKQHNDKELVENITSRFRSFIDNKFPDAHITVEDIFSYVYAILHSPAFRSRYNEFLKRDFPRVPIIEDFQVFKALTEIGSRLIRLHLLNQPSDGKIGFDVQGTDDVKIIRHRGDNVYINEKQHFTGINKDIWNYRIGGYQVLKRWLESRKRRKLSMSDIEHFISTASIIDDTLQLIEKIDEYDII